MSDNEDELYLENKELFDDAEDSPTFARYQKLIESAKKGDPEAMYEIAEEYGRTSGETEAMKWYLLAVSKNHIVSNCEIGLYYEKGRGVPVDHLLALEWFLKAAEGDYKYSHYRIATVFERGWGVPKDKRTALEWYYKFHEESSNIEDLAEQGFHITEQQKEKPLDQMIFEAQKILRMERLVRDKEYLNKEVASINEKNARMQKELDLADGRIKLLRNENKVLWEELEKEKTETSKKIEALENKVQEFIKSFHTQKNEEIGDSNNNNHVVS